MMDAVTIEEWEAQEMERIREFVIHWTRAIKDDPTSYPDRMDLGEWDEQYRIFES